MAHKLTKTQKEIVQLMKDNDWTICVRFGIRISSKVDVLFADKNFKEVPNVKKINYSTVQSLINAEAIVRSGGKFGGFTQHFYSLKK